jgi:hypothetical protein
MQLEELELRDVPSVTFFTMTDAVRAHDESGSVIWNQSAFGAFQGPVELSTGDVNGDGTQDAIIAAGPGGGPHVRVLNGLNGNQLKGFYAFAPTFGGGVFVASGDINHDGKADVITGAGPGGGPHVRVYDAVSNMISQSFFAGSPDYNGGVRVASFGGKVSTQLAQFELQSRPNSENTIFLSFAKDAPNQLIPVIWQQVANAFAPFNLNISTVQPTGPANTWGSVVIGGRGSASEGWAEHDIPERAMGVAIVNGYYESTPFQSKPAQVFADSVGWNNSHLLARAIVHEIGHLFGLDHITDPSSYMFEGLLPGQTRWDAISNLILSQRLGRYG